MNHETNKGVALRVDAPSKQLEIWVEGRKFTAYSFDDSFCKPFFTEIYNSRGNSYTRFEPFAKEHPHQRSVFIGIGDVNGTDYWNEFGKYGKQIHKAFISVGADGDSAFFSTENDWIDSEGNRVLGDTRFFRITKASEGKIYLDVSLCLLADAGELRIGQTKEAGPLGVRMADALRGDRGGLIRNADGEEGESGCWGKRSAYCSYGGQLEGTSCSLVYLDSPNNDGYPTYWHVRDYGLMAANNLFFTSGYTIPNGGCKRYDFRLVFLEGDAVLTSEDKVF